MPSIKGTASIPSNVAQTKLLRSTKFPSSFAIPVDLTKVNATVMAQWIEKKIESILGFEDEIVSSMAINLFFPKLNQDFSGTGAGAGGAGSSTTTGASTTTSSSSSSVQQKYAPVDPRKSQLDLVGFLGEEDAAKFSCELWEMLIDAQDQPRGIPKKLIEEKKRELAASSAVGAEVGAAKAALDTKSDYSARINNNYTSNYRTTNDSYRKENGIKGSSQMHPELGPGRTTITASRQATIRGRSEGFGPPPLLSRGNVDSRERQYVDHGRDRFRGEYSSFNTDYHSYSGRTSSRRITGSSSRDHEQGRERSSRGGHPPPPGGGAGYRRYDEDYPSGYSSADSYGRTRRRRKGRSSSGRRLDEYPSTYSRNHDGRRRSDRDDYEDYERRRTSSRRSRRSGKSGSPSRSISRSRSFSRTNQSPSTSSKSCSRSKKEEGYQGGDSSRYSRKRSRSRSKSPSYKRYSSDGRSSRR